MTPTYHELTKNNISFKVNHFYLLYFKWKDKEPIHFKQKTFQNIEEFNSKKF